MKALSSKEWSQKLNRFVLEQILLETGYPTDPLRLINFEVKKRKGKKKNCSLYKSETNLFQMLRGLYVVFKAMLRKIS